MNIGVDLHVTQGIHQGSRRYLEGLYAAALRLDQDNRYHLFVNDSARGEAPEWAGGARLLGFGTNSPLVRLSLAARRQARRHRIDLFHFQYNAPLWPGCPTLLTVHDLLFETHPRFFALRDRLRLRALTRRSVRRAAHVLTVSRYSERVLKERYGLPSERISLTPNGIDLSRFHPHGRAEARRRVAEALGLGEFFLSVGRIEPRKNYLGLLSAYKILRERRTDTPPLLIVGQPDLAYNGGAAYHRQLLQRIESEGLGPSVRLFDGAGDGLLADLYRATTLFLYPSFAEGFGLPPLEAMACGAPVLVSNTTALPEVVGSAGEYADPHEPESLANAIEQLLDDEDLRAELSLRGAARARCFSWERSARALLDVFARLGSESAGTAAA